jgi:UDP-N-acetylmuramoyl-L-alanyl-D-glutamate--2,6-diaminopimelate ligase
MRLGRLVEGLAGVRLATEDPSAPEADIRRLGYDSRAVGAGELFFCVSGFNRDGHEFAEQALARGAVALAVERPLQLGVPEVLCESVRDAMAPIAARFYGEPASELRVVGVTGTNGKTTTAYLLRALLEACGQQCGLLGTVKSVIGGRERAVQRTTPEAPDLQADLRAMLDGGDTACAIEVSSHALALGRADAIQFAAAIFTNLTQDHLDFHESMEDYFLAKRRLFLPPNGPAPGASVINIGDPYGRRLAGEVDEAITFAVERPADYSASDVHTGFDQCRFTLHAAGSAHAVAMPLPGRFNVANALGALAAAGALGHDLEPLLAALENGVRVPGRFEPVDEGQDFAVIVDYAHTPDSLENVLRAAVELVAAHDGRVICVFGAGGDRDRGKRPLMGDVAARLADEVVVTSDNPRSEDPDAIIAEILEGISDDARSERGYSPARGMVDRREAIEHALTDARPGDIVVIAGKGHEQGQEFAGGQKVPFDDAGVAREALRAHRRVAAWAK